MNMITSVSEIKAFNGCRRKWYLSGRNGLYLRPNNMQDAFAEGNAFHTCMEHMYKGEPYDVEKIAEEYYLDEDQTNTLLFQIQKYYEEVYLLDKEFMNVMDTELRFQLEIVPGIDVLGYIDVVYQDNRTGGFGVLEHKYVRNFRGETYNILDEQPKLYEIAVAQMYQQCIEGVNLNQVRKLKIKFDHSRVTLTHTQEQLDYFWEGFKRDALDMFAASKSTCHRASPDWMTCGFCDYRDLCTKMDIAATDDATIITMDDIIKAEMTTKEQRRAYY